MILFSIYFTVFQANGLNLVLENGYVVLGLNSKIWKSNKQYNDDQWHYLTVTKRAGRYEGGSYFTFKHVMHLKKIFMQDLLVNTPFKGAKT